MLNRRLFTGLLGASALPLSAHAAATLPFYASVGRDLCWYSFDEETGALSRNGNVTLPSNVQYAWPARGFVYVTASFNKPGGTDPEAGGHCVQAFRIGPDGELTPHGPVVPL